MLKQKDYKIADTNLANFGTQLEKDVKEAAALTDPEWLEVAQGKSEVGLKVWRIEKFTVKKWEEYGAFYSGDSYIVLRTYKKNDKFCYDVHFWLGAETTQDEAGTAAYKTVELDDVLKQAAIQHREVEGHESHQFLTYWKKYGGIRIMEGGCETGFRHVKPTEYRTRLLHIKGKRNVRVMEVPVSCDSLNEGDVFILDCGLNLYQWQGGKSSAMERVKGAQLARAIDDERMGKAEVMVLSQGDEDDHAEAFWAAMGGKGEIKNHTDGGCDLEWEKEGTHKLWRISDEKGKIGFTLEVEGPVAPHTLESKDAFLLDVGCELFVWIGKNASKDERRLGLAMAQDYLVQNNKPHWLPISRILEGGENDLFKHYLAGPGNV